MLKKLWIKWRFLGRKNWNKKNRKTNILNSSDRSLLSMYKHFHILVIYMKMINLTVALNTL